MLKVKKYYLLIKVKSLGNRECGKKTKKQTKTIQECGDKQTEVIEKWKVKDMKI